MIVEYIRYAVAEDRADALLRAYRDAATELRASTHCLAYEVSRCTEDRAKIVVRIEWDSADGHLQGFRKEPGFAAFFAKVKPFFEQIEEMRHYEVIDAMPRRGS